MALQSDSTLVTWCSDRVSRLRLADASSEIGCHPKRGKSDVFVREFRGGNFRAGQPFVQCVIEHREYFLQVALYVGWRAPHQVLPCPVIGKSPELCVGQQRPELHRHVASI